MNTAEPAGTDRPRFSVIMPVYNHADYVAEAIESVRAQTRGDWELIAVDDGSSDRSAEIVADIAGGDGRIVAIRQANAGPAAARNTAIARARGDWLAFIDSDDVYLTDALASYAAYVDSHPRARFIHGYRHRIDADGAITELAGEFQDRVTGTAELFQRMYLSHLCVCYRRDLLKAVGGYDERLRSCEDYDLYLRLSLHCRFEPLGKPTGLRRRHATNLSRQSGYSRLLEAEVLRRFVDANGGRELLGPDAVHRRLGRLYYAASRQYFRSRCFRQSVAAAAMAHRHRRTFKSTAMAVLARCLLPVGRDDGRPAPQL